MSNYERRFDQLRSTGRRRRPRSGQRPNVSRRPVLYLDRPRFEKEVLPDLTFSPRVLIQFATVLPFDMAIRPGLALLKSLDERSAVHLVITRAQILLRIGAGVLFTKKTDLPSARTKLELTYISGQDLNLPAHSEFQDDHLGFLNEALSASLETANQIILAYQMITKDDRPRRLSSEALENLSLARIVPLPSWEPFSGIYVHSKDPLLTPEDLDESAMDQLTELYTRFAVEPSAVLIAEEIALAASQHLRYGRWAEAVIYAQVSIETLLRALVGSMSHEESQEQCGIRNEEEFPTLKNVVTRELHQRLGGNWNLNDDRSPVGRWWQHAYMLRNRIVHSGHIPGPDAAGRALGVAEEFRNWLAQLVITRGDQYPNTAELVRVVYSNIP